MLLSLLSLIYPVENDFGIFNYSGSRLKTIKRYDGGNKLALDQYINYTYNDEGYLIGRELKAGRKLIYKSKIEYSDDKKAIKEYFERGEGNNRIPPVILEYYYNEKNQLINYKRIDGNIYNDNMEIGRDVSIEYNDKNDIILIGNNIEMSVSYEPFFPGDGFAREHISKYRYEYFDDKKVAYYYDQKRKIEFILSEYYYKDSKLNKIIHLPNFLDDGKKTYSFNNFIYDDKGNLIRSIFKDTIIDNKEKYKIVDYVYDSENRLIKRILYYNTNNLKKLKIENTEEYIYEDGKYAYYPYLLPLKIKMYLAQQYETLVDKNVF